MSARLRTFSYDLLVIYIPHFPVHLSIGSISNFLYVKEVSPLFYHLSFHFAYGLTFCHTEIGMLST